MFIAHAHSVFSIPNNITWASALISDSILLEFEYETRIHVVVNFQFESYTFMDTSLINFTPPSCLQLFRIMVLLGLG